MFTGARRSCSTAGGGVLFGVCGFGCGRGEDGGVFSFVDLSYCFVVVLEVVGVGDDVGQVGVWADASFVDGCSGFYCFDDFSYDFVEGPVQGLALFGGAGEG